MISERRVGVLRIGIVAPPWFDIPPLGYGGIESMCFQLVQGLVARGHAVTLVASGSDKTRADFVQSYSEAPSGRLGEPLPEVIHATVAEQALGELHPDVVHDHSLAGPLLAFSRAVPTVVTAHGPVDHEMELYYRRISSAVALVAISEAQRRLAPHLPWAGMVHNAIPVAEYPLKTDKEPYALWLGRINPSKGVLIAIEVARAAGIPLVLAGKCSEPQERRYFEEQVEPNLGGEVEWAGEAKGADKKELLAGARCLLFPIQWEEPFGLVMIEAMACGTPVVGLRRGSVPEVVVDEVTGFVCEDPTELVSAVHKSNDIDPRACRKHVEAHFDTGVMVSGYEDIYLSVVQA